MTCDICEKEHTHRHWVDEDKRIPAMLYCGDHAPTSLEQCERVKR